MISNIIGSSWIEPTAVILAIAYLLLAIKQNISCWFAAFFSSLLYFFVMYSAGLYMEAGLQIFYCIMAVYGWTQWRITLPGNSKFLVKTWNRDQHIKAILLIILLAIVSGWALEKFTNAALPFLDSLTTWGAIVTTYMVAKRLLENWIYWFVIDTISVFLFYSRGLILTSILFLVYLIIIYFGYKSWTQMKDEISQKS
ncbi:nicotinamide riboside transporter PnuC [Gammaproteobacteria bacterium]|jgi:nicotinamide mononucleotide transporter|nr:nicotinamide riboside transporter PnuC [Pseudomonadota bacterium]MDA9561684.1 nicotinamide riboside transporter PnuC [Gammaproteobacteria bacterium]MDA1083634.1 nicotinamide riboside transporter PnuC [Pseudomonadota bacterium]MDA9765913.1 nicotinamide riboside transporter PnuC [Gammaproteobacteria bacterium]MDA9804862.1 nicotinamide riboside transporter PnuC [Gammaproteobacteria bacterium]|tara:strand:- start:723 stop:1316 length:594 start_codon:yes stop_codon:yes gene_type:complete